MSEANETIDFSTLTFSQAIALVAAADARHIPFDWESVDRFWLET